MHISDADDTVRQHLQALRETLTYINGSCDASLLLLLWCSDFKN